MEKETGTAEKVVQCRKSPRDKRKLNDKGEEASPSKTQPNRKRKPNDKAEEASPSKKQPNKKRKPNDKAEEASLSKKQPSSKSTVEGTSSVNKATKRRNRSNDYKTLLTRMSPSMITNLIKLNPSEKQIEAIQSMGFGGLLKLQTEEINGHLARWIVESFNPFDCSLMNGNLDITDEDVYLATGIPMGPLEIVQVGRYCKAEAYLEAVKRFKGQFSTSNITKKLVLEKMMEQRDGGDDFKRNFLVYIVSTLLMGVIGDAPSTRILSCLGDLSDVPKFNWCKFARDHMMDNVISWKKAVVSDPNTYFKGPILIFIFIYLDRVVFKSRTVSRSFPLLANWSDEKIRERVKLEKHEANCFGKGRVVDRLVYHSETVHETEEKHRLNDATTDKVDGNEEGCPLDEKKKCINILAGSAVHFADSYDAFSKAIRQAKSKVPGIAAVSQMESLADSLFEGFSMSQQSRESEREGERDGAAGVGGYASGDKVELDQKMKEDKVQQDEEKVEPETEEEEKKDEVYLDDDFLENLSVLADLEGVLNNAYNHVGKVFKEHGDNVGKEKIEKELIEGPSFSLFTGDDAPYTSQEFLDSLKFHRDKAPHAGVPHVSTSPTPFISSPVVVQCPVSPMIIPSQPSPIVIPSQPSPIVISSQLSMDESPIMPSSPLVQVSPIAPSEHAMETRQPKRVLSKRNVEVADVYRSPFFIRNVDVMRDLSQSEKEIGDYAFACDLDEGEVLFSHTGKSLTRRDLKTLLLGSKVHSDVITVWCDYLNDQNRLRARTSRCRLFFTEATDINSLDVNFEEVKLVFTPVVTPTPLLFCFHVENSLFEVIHPMDAKQTDYSVHVRDVKKLLISKLGEKIPKLNAAWFLIAKVYVPNSTFDVECDTGIYLMRHMETYNGTKSGYSSKVLKDRYAVKRYIVRVCNQILTWANNSLKVQVTSKAKASNNGCEIRNQVRQELCYTDARNELGYTDAQLMNFIKTNVANKNDVVVATQWLEVTQEALQTLQRGSWVMDMVIDLVGLRTTLEKPGVVYFPTIMKDVVPKDGFRSQYIKLDYLPQNLTKAQLAFFPFCVLKAHWFACVSDFVKRKNFILDSSLPRRPDARRTFLVDTLLPALEIIARDRPGYKRLLQIKTFQWEIVNVPQQKNGYACGIYLLKWLENLCFQASWTDETCYEDLDEYGESMILELIKWEQNKRKVFD